LVVTARNTAPSGLSLSKNVTGLSATVSGTFADPDPLDSHDVTMLWGDGTTSTSTLVAGATLFSATHTYLSAGTFTVTVTVTDPAAASTSGATSVVATAAASTVSDVLDQMAAFVESLGLSPNTERWLLRKIDDLRASAAGGGNAQLCASAKVLGHLSAYAGRVLTNDQAAALDSLGKQLETAAGCAGSAIANQKVQKTTRVTTTVPPTQKKETTTNDENKGVAAKSDKSDKTEKSDKVDSTKKSGTQSGSSKEGRNSR
jgi:PKD repeat protein